MNEIIWISIVAGLAVVTLFALNGVRIVKKRERLYLSDENAAKSSLEKIDSATDNALSEIEKTANLVLGDINEKYQAMLFLYNLLDEKKKEINAITEIKIPKRQAAEAIEEPAPNKVQTPPAAATYERKPKQRAPRTKINTRYDKVLKMHDDGLSVAEIAKNLNIGQGEVQLTMDLAKKERYITSDNEGN